MTINYLRYHELAAAEDLTTLRKVLRQIAEDFGFPFINLTVVSFENAGQARENALRIDPPGWDSYVLEPTAVRDPCLKLVASSQTPFSYDQHLYVQHGAGGLWEQQAPFGFKTGVTAVLHAKAGRRLCGIGLDREEPLPKDKERLMRLMADLQLLVAFAQDKAFSLLLADPPITQSVKLSARERDVLAWASQGKTSWETGRLLSISEHTVKKHLASAANRLGCSTKAQAVARAIEKGLL